MFGGVPSGFIRMSPTVCAQDAIGFGAPFH